MLSGNGENMPEMGMEAPVEISLLHNPFDEKDMREGQSTPALMDLKTAETSKREENQLSTSPGKL